jgi:hypothetical protein
MPSKVSLHRLDYTPESAIPYAQLIAATRLPALPRRCAAKSEEYYRELMERCTVTIFNITDTKTVNTFQMSPQVGRMVLHPPRSMLSIDPTLLSNDLMRVY